MTKAPHESLAGASPALLVQGAGSDAPAQLSYAQQRMWFFNQLEPTSALYNRLFGPLGRASRSCAARWVGPLDVHALERSLGEIVRRHEVLRTRYPQTGDGIIPEVLPVSPFRLPLEDLSGLPHGDRERSARERVLAEYHRPFDLTVDPPIRAVLLRLGPEEYVLVAVIHHIAYDRWSRGILLWELAVLYTAYAAGHLPRLPEPRLQYSDYARWQREQLQGEALARDLAFWRQRLLGASDRVPLPSDRLRPTVPSHDGGCCAIPLTGELVTRLERLAHAERASLMMVLVSALQAQLGGYTGQPEVSLGIAVAGRTRPELEEMIGCCTNTLVLRTDLSGDPTFRELLRRVRREMLRAYAHQELPFERLVEELRPTRTPGYHPFFQVLFNYLEVPRRPAEIPGVRMEDFQVGLDMALVDLSVHVERTGAGTVCYLTYSRDLFDHARVARWADDYAALLQAVAAAPDRRLSVMSSRAGQTDVSVAADLLADLEQMSEEDAERALGIDGPHSAIETPARRAAMTPDVGSRDAMLVRCVRPPADFVEFPRREVESSIAARFERVVERHPDRVAVKVGDAERSYDALNAAANRVAHALLRGRGEASEQVAVLCERDHAMIEAALGVLKAGKLWVPLDTSYPRARNAYILEHSQATVLLTDEMNAGTAEQLASGTCTVVTLGQSLASRPETNPALSIPPDAAACLLYTSGSTGRPKGVVHNQRTVLHLIRRFTNALAIAPSDRASLLASCSQMSGVSSLFRALLNGATTLPQDPRRLGPAELAEWIQREAISVWHMAPTLFRHVVRTFRGDEAFPELRLIHLGGEPVGTSDVDLFRRHFSRSCLLLNNFGCTEISSFRQYVIDHDTRLSGPSVPVGYAMEDTDVLILDENGGEALPGQPGEIAVRSRYVALGYWRDPEQTRARFTTADAEDGPRIYRTGDLGYLLPDGCLMHLGRLDFQVQIRGNRVETGEVEHALMDSGQLDACAVVGCDDPSGQTQLVAYLVPARSVPCEAGGLRALLQSKLPSYMVPAVFVWLEALPRLPNGKLNRRALPTPEWAGSIQEDPFVAPRTPLEEAIAGIWGDVLGVARVGIHDDVFALGANSLHLTRSLSRIRRSVWTDVSLEALFDFPTVAGLALAIERDRAAATSPSSPRRDGSHP